MKTLPISFIVILFVCSGILLVIGLLGLTGIWNKLKGKFKHQSKTNIVSTVQQIKHTKRPSTLASLYFVCLFSSFLVFGLSQIYYLTTGQIPFHLDFSNIVLFPISFILFPIYTLADIFYIRRRYYRFNRSITVDDADFIIDGNINYIFDNYRRLIVSMSDNPQKVKAKSPNLLKTKIGTYKIIIEIKRRKDNKINVYIVSDTLNILTTHDNGINQNNIKVLTNYLYELVDETQNVGSIPNS